jgi:hypothetical protein
MRARTILTTLFGLSAAALLMGCAAQSQGGQAPNDLLITYEWREGSLPPPYHYEYSIRLQADGSGEVTMIPDYPGEGVPVWNEPFTVAPAALNQMYATMQASGLLSERWSELDDPPVGGSSANMTVVAAGRTVTIPAFLPPAQQGRAETIYATLRGVVPQAIFDDLEARRAAYELEHAGS